MFLDYCFLTIFILVKRNYLTVVRLTAQSLMILIILIIPRNYEAQQQGKEKSIHANSKVAS